MEKNVMMEIKLQEMVVVHACWNVGTALTHKQLSVLIVWINQQ